MTREEIIEQGQVVYKKPTLLNDTPMHYCPGCSHGVVHKIVSEVIEEMGMTDKTIAISPVGCAVFAYKYIDVDWEEAAHGRAPALASAANLEGTCYVTRQSVHNVASINRTKKAIRKAFEYSMQGKGSNLVEVVSTCNSGWKMSPEKANKWMEENMFPFYQLGDLKDKGVEL